MNKYYIVKTKITNYYSFLKKLNNINIDNIDIKCIDKYIYFKIKKESFKKLVKYLPSYKYIIVNNKRQFIIRNKEFLISIILGIVMFLIISNLIIEVKIIHSDSEIRELLTEELYSYGIKPLHFKKSYKNLQIIKERIKNK